MKRIGVALALTLVVLGLGVPSAFANSGAFSRPIVVGSAHESVTPARAKAVRYALSKVGHRYVWGATGPNVFDCSGLVQASYRSAGIRLPRTTGGLQRLRRVPLSQLQPGDLVEYPGHVAIYIGHGRQVAAANWRTGVKTQAVYRGAMFGTRVA